MKKVFLFFYAFLFSINVKALSIYSDYKFVGYTDKPRMESENFRYEEVHLHKYYKTGKTNIVYAPINSKIEMSPYVDEESIIYSKYHLRSKSELAMPRFVLYTKLEESFRTRTINLNNFTTNNNEIYEIDIFVNEEEINYNVDSDYSFLNDNITDSGEMLNNAYITLELDKVYDVKDIKILIHFKTEHSHTSYFTISFVNENGNSNRFGVVLDAFNGEYKTKWLEFKLKDEFITFLVENHIFTEEQAFNNVSAEAYEYNLPLYMHYDVTEEFYKYSFLNQIEGYSYNQNEDTLLYKVYVREFLGDDKAKINDVSNKAETKSCKELKTISKNIKTKETNESSNTTEPFVYTAFPINNKSEKINSDNGLILDEKDKLKNPKITIIIIASTIIMGIIGLVVYIRISNNSDKFTD